MAYPHRISKNLALSNLYVQILSLAPNIQADYISLNNSAYNMSIAFSSVNVTINLANSGVNGRDTGSLTSGFWWLYLISNGKTIAGLASLSATSPSMPSGYAYKRRVSVINVYNSGALARPAIQCNDHYRYWGQQNTLISGGTAIFPTTVNISSMIPSQVNIGQFFAYSTVTGDTEGNKQVKFSPEETTWQTYLMSGYNSAVGCYVLNTQIFDMPVWNHPNIYYGWGAGTSGAAVSMCCVGFVFPL